jgi:hypothetical protein
VESRHLARSQVSGGEEGTSIKEGHRINSKDTGILPRRMGSKNIIKKRAIKIRLY